MSKTSRTDSAIVLKYLENTRSELFQKIEEQYDDTKVKGIDIIKSIDEYLYQKVCNELEYCKNRIRFSYMDTKSLSDVLLEKLEDISEITETPRELVVAFLIKTGLNHFCKCQ